MIDVTKEIEHLFRLSKREPGKRFNQLWSVTTAPEWLAQAWQNIRSNQGSRTPGIDGETGADIDVKRIISLSERLQTGRYRPKPVRRVYIPKANGKQRPLGIPAIEDRIVQQALRMVLEPIFEADFLDCSHGFRRKLSAHTALTRVAMAYPKTSWIVEGDIVGCFDNIPHETLLGAVSRKIADEKVMSLIREFLKAGYMEDQMLHRTYSGTPQGGIVSPLLCNIFLHQLDEFFVQELKANQSLTKEQSYRRKSRDYQRTGRELHKRRVMLKHAPRCERKQLLEEIAYWEKKRNCTPTVSERHPCKLSYVRYADDFVIMVNGTKEDAETVKRQVAEKLEELGLKLSEEKTKITHWQDPVSFLGFNVQGRLRPRGVQITAIFSIPASKIREVSTEIRTVCGWHQLPEADVMCRVGAIFRGWCNYYCYASGPQTVFGRVSFRAWWRYAHFLAQKRRLSIAEVIRHEKRANRLRRLTVGGKMVQTFHTQAEGRHYVLNIVPPKTRSLWNVTKPKAHWWGDHRPTTPEEWNTWRIEMKRLDSWPPPTRGVANTTSIRNRNQTGTPDAPKGARPVWEGLHGNHDSKEA